MFGGASLQPNVGETGQFVAFSHGADAMLPSRGSTVKLQTHHANVT